MLGAENGTRTRDPNLGKVVLYQLSYFRKFFYCKKASLLIAGAKVMLFSELTKLFAVFFQKNFFLPPFRTFPPSISTLITPSSGPFLLDKRPTLMAK